MDASPRAQSLPAVYEEVLDLDSRGYDENRIAEVLDVAVETVPTLLALARVKHARHERHSPDPIIGEVQATPEG